MIVSRTPFRISFLGGGTDYPAWYRRYGGNVLSASINKYGYHTIRYLPPFFEHRIRVVYSKIELCRHFSEIQHPSVRETLRFLNFDRGLEIHYDGDLPARSGIGSSSSFTVGLLHACYALRGRMAGKKQLAMESIHIEQNMIRETVGSQDQVAAAFGGLNRIVFKKNDEIEIQPLTLSKARYTELLSHLMLFYTGIKRNACDIADSYVEKMDANQKVMTQLNDMVQRGVDILQGDMEISGFGDLLREAWVLKRQLSPDVSTPVVDDLLNRAMESGALGGKLTGAGGGGFILLFVPPDRRGHVMKALKNLLHVPFGFDFNGSQIIVYEPRFDEYGDDA